MRTLLVPALDLSIVDVLHRSLEHPYQLYLICLHFLFVSYVFHPQTCFVPSLSAAKRESAQRGEGWAVEEPGNFLARVRTYCC